MIEPWIVPLLALLIVCCGVSPAALLWLFMTYQAVRGKPKRKPDEAASFDDGYHEPWYWLDL